MLAASGRGSLRRSRPAPIPRRGQGCTLILPFLFKNCGLGRKRGAPGGGWRGFAPRRRPPKGRALRFPSSRLRRWSRSALRRRAFVPRPRFLNRNRVISCAPAATGPPARAARARRSDARPTRGQPYETCTNRRRSGCSYSPRNRRGHGVASTRAAGDLWRFRKANPLVDEPWATGPMDMNVHRSLTAAFPRVGIAFSRVDTAGRGRAHPGRDAPASLQAFATGEILRLRWLAPPALRMTKCQPRRRNGAFRSSLRLGRAASAPPTRICRRRRGRLRPVGSFDFAPPAAALRSG